ncbi:MAG: hypothetical protein K6G64_08970 [Eubacterium sp.]|nr:hypothetical protein [Eubacterium sp.]
MRFIITHSRMIIIVIFLIISGVFLWRYYLYRTNINYNGPAFSVEQELLECSVKDDEKALIKGIVATDREDGDLSNKIIVESISKFVDKKEHICNITYAVEDSEHHVSKVSRKIKYVDYQPPRFVLSEPLCFDVGSDTTVVDVLGAKDGVDGDVSGKIKILSNTTATSVAGKYTVTAQVTNSLGDTAKFKSIVVIKQRNNLSPVISLKKNVVYLKVGDIFNAKEYIASVKSPEGKNLGTSAVEVTNTNVNMKKAGFYTVEFTVNGGESNENTTYLTVIVEE